MKEKKPGREGERQKGRARKLAKERESGKAQWKRRAEG